MHLVSFLQEHVRFLLLLFGLGCLVSYIREYRPGLSVRARRRLALAENLLIVPGFAGVFITAQEFSTRSYALFPGPTIAAFFVIVAGSAALLLAKKRDRPRSLAWLGHVFGLAGIAFPLALLALFLSSPKQIAELRETFQQLDAATGQTAPEFSFTLVEDGSARSLSDYRGQVVLLNLWATWCAPCRREMPDLDRLQQKHQRAGLIVLHLSDEPTELLRTYLGRNPASTTHGRADRTQVPEFYRFSSARPATFIIDRTGRVVATVVGAKDFDYFDAALGPHL